MKSHRLARVNEVVREVAATTILFELKDPRVKKSVTVTRAEVSADLQHAKVFVSVMGTDKEQQLTMHGLRSSAGFIQTKVAERLTTRFVPHITFVVDDGVKKSIEIARLIREGLEQTRVDEEARTARAAALTEADAAEHPAAPPDAADGPAAPAV